MVDITVRDWTCWRDASHSGLNTTIFGWPACCICHAAPPYHERPAYLPVSFVLGIYVPSDSRSTAIIAPRSAVVGLPDGGDDPRIDVHYEGWINRAMQYANLDADGQWRAGIEHAATRMICDYPTIAQANLPSTALRYVGLYHPRTKEIEVDDPTALREWLK